MQPTPSRHLSNSLFPSDTFSHRLDSGNVVWVQKIIAEENLIRNNFGNVCSKTVKIKNNIPIQEIVDKLVSAFNIKQKMYSDGIFSILIGERNIILVEERKKKYNGELDREIIVPEGKREIMIYLTTSIYDNYINLEKLLGGLGLTVLGDFDDDEGDIPVTFAYPGQRGVQYKTHSFDSIRFDTIKQNYDEKVVNQVENLLERIRKEHNGIIILHGNVGTGKTFLVRSIVSEVSDRRVVVCSPPMQFLENAGMLNDVTLNFSKTFTVFEDIGDILTQEGAVTHVGARSNLLNLSDGLMSLLSDSIFIVTFNHDIGKIDPAVIRNGRCLANIEVGLLKFKQVRQLVGFDIPEKEYTLAQVYEMKNTGKPLEKIVGEERKIGFGR